MFSRRARPTPCQGTAPAIPRPLGYSAFRRSRTIGEFPTRRLRVILLATPAGAPGRNSRRSLDKPAIRLLLADDHPLFRAGVRALLQGLAGYEIVAEAADGEQALRLCRELRPDIALIDIGLPGLTGLEVAQRLHEEDAGIRVLIVSAHSDEEYVRQALRLEVAGYLSKDSTTEELEVRPEGGRAGLDLPQPDGLAAGGPRLRPPHRRRGKRSHAAPAGDRAADRGRAEHQGDRAPPRACSVKTVETHRGQIMQRLGVDSVAGVTRYAIRGGSRLTLSGGWRRPDKRTSKARVPARRIAPTRKRCSGRPSNRRASASRTPTPAAA